MPGPDRTPANLDPRRRRLLYRAWHRGTLEMDLLMGSFCESVVADLTLDELTEFERLIEVPDHSLYAWITASDDIPPEYRSALLDRLATSRAHRMSRRS